MMKINKESGDQKKQVVPRASMLIESMRAIGYSLNTALADIIDNSITAKARKIELLANTTGEEPNIAVLDDGIGMSSDELLEAMRLGSSSPLENRKSNDLGRFGLGLKTASFSQCRRLTVVTRQHRQTSSAQWDLDEVANSDDWLINWDIDTKFVPYIEQLGDRGTLVVWENLDRLAPENLKDKNNQLVRQLSDAMQHLELVFHRYLSGEYSIRKIEIRLNNNPLESFDPFFSKHSATQMLPEERIRMKNHDVIVQGFTLPHHKNVSKSDWERLGGKDGYLKSQGFYVYRNKRLITYGTWFGIIPQTELTKLARIRIDTPNTLDGYWKIDVKKSTVQPPAPVRERLKRIIDEIGKSSKRTYTKRGAKLATESKIPVWNRVQSQNEINYILDQDHPIFEKFVIGLKDIQAKQFSEILELISSTIPTDSLYADMCNNPESVKEGKISQETLNELTTTTYKILATKGVSSSDIVAMLFSASPFKYHLGTVEKILNNIKKGHK